MVKTLFFFLLPGAVFAASVIELPTQVSDQNDQTAHVQLAVRRKEVDRIVGGNHADRGEYPFLIVLRYNGRFRCGGSILDEKTILTAAHCVDDDSRQRFGDFSIKAGDYQTYLTEASEQIRKVKKVIMHKKYSAKKNDKDIAILKLTVPLTFNEYVQKITFAGKAQEKQLLSSPKCFVAGIGDDEYGLRPFRTQEVSATVQSRKDCAKEASEYKPKFTKFMICTLDNLKGACSGDSGGPLTCYDDNDNPFQVGIVSWGSANCVLGFNVYARVSTFKPWINRYLEK